MPTHRKYVRSKSDIVQPFTGGQCFYIPSVVQLEENTATGPPSLSQDCQDAGPTVGHVYGVACLKAQDDRLFYLVLKASAHSSGETTGQIKLMEYWWCSQGHNSKEALDKALLRKHFNPLSLRESDSMRVGACYVLAKAKYIDFLGQIIVDIVVQQVENDLLENEGSEYISSD